MHFLSKIVIKSDKKVQTSDTLNFCAESVHSNVNFCTFDYFLIKIFNQKSLSFSILKNYIKFQF